jgi:hypothetical protein
MKLMRHRILFAVAAAAAGAACLNASALARGSGGHGGTASHGAATAYGARAYGARAYGARGSVVFAHGGSAASLYRSVSSGRVLTARRPEVINVPAALGTGGINPPFSGSPIVPPFGTGGGYAGWPAVVTPYAGAPVFGYRFDGAVADVAAPASGVAAPNAGAPQAVPAEPNALHGTCHPVPHGYHCDWSS